MKNKKNRNIGKIIAVCAVLAFVGAVYYTYAQFNGSLILKAVATARARAYTEEKYGGEYEVGFAKYNFKSNGYRCEAEKAGSPDSAFSVYPIGGEITDDYDSRVGGMENVINRLSDEMDCLADEAFVKAYPYKTDLIICRFDFEVGDIDREKLLLGMPLDMRNPVHPLELTLWVNANEPSWEKLEEACREAVRTCDLLGWDISRYSVTLVQKSEDEKPASGTTEYRCERLERERILSGDFPR